MRFHRLNDGFAGNGAIAKLVAFRNRIYMARDGNAVVTVDDFNRMNNFDDLRMIVVPEHDVWRIDNLTRRAFWTRHVNHLIGIIFPDNIGI